MKSGSLTFTKASIKCCLNQLLLTL